MAGTAPPGTPRDRDYDRARSHAYHRAVRRLKARHQTEWTKLLDEELAKAGVPMKYVRRGNGVWAKLPEVPDAR